MYHQISEYKKTQCFAHTVCVFHTIHQTAIISLNITNQLVFLNEDTVCFCEVGTQPLNIIQISFRLQRDKTISFL
jgi:hypothetical protein